MTFTKELPPETQKEKFNLTLSLLTMIETPTPENAKQSIRHLAKLARKYNIEIFKKTVKPEQTSFINDKLFAKTGEMAQNNRGLKETLPELHQLIISFIKIKALEPLKQ